MSVRASGRWRGLLAAAGLCSALVLGMGQARAQAAPSADAASLPQAGSAASGAAEQQAPAAKGPAGPGSAPGSAKETSAQANPADSAASRAEAASQAIADSKARCARFSGLCDRSSQLNLAIFAALLYLGAMLMVRWHMIARPARALLEAEIQTMRRRTEALAGQPAHAAILGLLTDAEGKLGVPDPMDWFFWSRGQEHAGWQLVHEAKELWTAAQPPEALRTSLIEAEADLRALGSTAQVALADAVKEALSTTPVDLRAPDLAVLRSALALLQRTATDSAAAAKAWQARTDAQTDDWAAWGHQLARALKAGAALSGRLTAALETGPVGEPAALLQDLQASLLPEWDAQLEAVAALLERPGDKQATVAEWQALAQGLEATWASVARPLARRIEAALAAAPLAEHPRWRALAEEARNQIYEQRDNAYADIAGWHKKTGWLVAAGLMLIIVLTAQFGHVEFFLLGALGGLLGRLSRTQSTQALPTDYGAYWTTLFLSPVVGALTGWGCLLLMAWAVDLKLLGEVFRALLWDAPHSLPAMGAALLFGALERGFVSLVSKFEQTTDLGGKRDEPLPKPPVAQKAAPPVAVSRAPAAPPAPSSPPPPPAAPPSPTGDEDPAIVKFVQKTSEEYDFLRHAGIERRERGGRD